MSFDPSPSGAAGSGRHAPNNATRCGLVAVVGAPNAGKSTLVNRLVGTKVSIVSPKAQTTRDRVRGIVVEGQSQIVLVDNPGVFSPRHRFDAAMVAAAWDAAKDADELLVLVDSAKGAQADTQCIVSALKAWRRRAILVLNKVDLAEKPTLLDLAGKLAAEGVFEAVFMVSARTGDGVQDLVSHIADRLPEGPWLFPEDQVSDVPLALFAAEITREKLYFQLKQELPYAAAVETERWVEQQDGSVRIEQVIYVERPSQKIIVVGKGGQRIKCVGEAARKELEHLLDRRVHLFLFVKVWEKWKDDPDHRRALSLDSSDSIS